ncbi:WD40/YVTN/BNR-like repeat-containing protein [Actinocrispum wychmicini]|uniref:WD40/YVTN/BNR-like repeat-containing protein n=1 Tax=Actinocrispum wychmicini TaxID=1213861 RepID=UPI0010448994|nr:glycosyl hydrolase [Actinocrispum wychmicini]
MAIVAAVVVAAGVLTSAAAQVAGSEDVDQDADSGQVDEDEDVGGPQAPADFLNDRFSSFQTVTDDQVQQAEAQAAEFGENGENWRLVGPSNVGGRVTGLVVDPRRPNTIYVAAAGGGVWRSTDAGNTFQSAWPSRLPQALGALEMGRDGTLWAGTGEANPSGGGLTFFGNGVYRSDDGGRSWDSWGLTHSGSIGRILVDPVNPRRVFVAATGNLSGTAQQRGIYRLDNNGRDWRLVLPAPNKTTGGVDLAMDPTNHNRIYAVLWDHQRNNGARVYGGVGSGLFRSDNGGDTWTRLENVIGTAPTDKTGTGLHSDATLGRIGIAVAPNDPNRVYVITATQYGPDKGFYYSNDGGTTLAPGGHAGGDSGYAWWFGKLWVDPKDKTHLFEADVNLRESTDSGTTWHVSAGVHADQHAMQWDPNQPGRVYLGNDGGVYRSDTNGASASWVHATYEPFNQSYHLAVARDDPTRLATGLQDNGSVRTWTATTPPGDLTQWNAYGGGDGHEVLIDYSDHNVYYECSQVGVCHRHEDSSGTSKSINFGARHSTRTTTDAPIIQDPNNPNIVYFGGNVLDRSTDRGTTFTQISPPGDFLTGPVPPNEDDKGPFYANEYATITWIAPAKTDPNTIYLGTDTGRLWKTTDLGAHWTEFTGKGLPTRWVNSVVVDPTDARHVFVAFSGYREGDLAANVWESTDGGTNWDNISGRLPNAPVEMLAYDQSRQRLYAATDLGVFVNRDGRRNWRRLGRGLPNTSILDIKITGDGRTLYAATFGRSVWAVRIDD